MSDSVSRLRDFIEKDNAAERQDRRAYYDYLVETRGETTPFEQFETSYGGLGVFGTPIADAVIDRFGPAIAFPADLIAFYRAHGAVRGLERQLNVTIFDLETLNEHRTARDNAPLFRSLGLVHMIEYLWSDRDQITPASGQSLFTQDEIEQLNLQYQVVGYWVDANASTEAMHLLYYDRTGLFGIAYLHQDEWDISYLLEGSRAQYTFGEALGIYLDTMAALTETEA